MLQFPPSLSSVASSPSFNSTDFAFRIQFLLLLCYPSISQTSISLHRPFVFGILDPPESCVVCLYEFEAKDEIRRLANCRHIFHRGCLDRWIGYGQRTCPLCRTVFIPPDLRSGGCNFDDRLWEDSEIFEVLLSDSSSSSLLAAGL